MEKNNDQVSLSEISGKLKVYLNRIYNNRGKFIFINAIVFIVLLVYLLFFIKPVYVSTVDIMPNTQQNSSILGKMGQLGGLASLAGVNLGASGDQGPIYESLIYSETVLKPVILNNYKTLKYPEPINLINYYKIEQNDRFPDSLRLRRAFLETIRFLTQNKIITTALNKKTGILTLNIRTKDYYLSSQIADNIVFNLDKYLKTQIKSYSSEQRQYLEIRNGQVKDSLSIAEEELKNFRERNRVAIQSPDLLLKQARLMRNVEILQTIFIEISKQLELAKISELQNSDVLNIKDKPEVPLLEEPRKRPYKLIIGMIISMFITAMYFILMPEVRNLFSNKSA